ACRHRRNHRVHEVAARSSSASRRRAASRRTRRRHREPASRIASMRDTVTVHTRGSNYLNDETTIRSWATTTDHKRIGLMFLVATTLALALGGTFALVMRLELLTPP